MLAEADIIVCTYKLATGPINQSILDAILVKKVFTRADIRIATDRAWGTVSRVVVYLEQGGLINRLEKQDYSPAELQLSKTVRERGLNYPSNRAVRKHNMLSFGKTDAFKKWMKEEWVVAQKEGRSAIITVTKGRWDQLPHKPGNFSSTNRNLFHRPCHEDIY